MDPQEPFLPVHSSVNKDEQSEKEIAAAKRMRMAKWGACFLVTVGIVLICIFVGGAAVAQMATDNTGITIVGMGIANMTNTTFISKVVTQIDNRMPFAASLSHHEINLVFGGKKMATMQLPHVDLEGATTKDFIFDDRFVQVTYPDVFDEFGAALMNNEFVDLKMSGHIDVHALGLTFNVKLDKTVPMAGMNAFSTNAVKSNLAISSTTDSVSLDLVVDLTNPSVATFDNLESLSLTAFYNDVEVGVAYSTDETLPMVQGVNTYAMRSVLTKNVNNTAALETLLSNYVNGQDITLTLRGNDDSCPLVLLKNAMSSLVIHSTFNGLETVVVQEHPPTMYNLTSYNDSLLADIPPHLSGSYLRTRTQGKDEFLFSAVFGEFVFPDIVTKPDPVGCPDSQFHLYTDVTLLLNNPFGMPVGLYEVDVDVMWNGDSAYNYPQTFFATGNTAATETPYVVIGPYGTALYKQRLCVSDDSAFLSTFLTVYLPQKLGQASVTSLYESELAFPLEFQVNGTVNAKAGDYAAEIAFKQEHVPVWVFMSSNM